MKHWYQVITLVVIRKKKMCPLVHNQSNMRNTERPSIFLGWPCQAFTLKPLCIVYRLVGKSVKFSLLLKVTSYLIVIQRGGKKPSSCHSASTCLTDLLWKHPSLSSTATEKSSRLYPVSSQNYCIYVLAGRPAFACSYEEVHWSMSLMCSPLCLQRYQPCLVRLTWIVFVMGGRWLYISCFVGCYRQDLFNIAHSLLV